MPKRHPRKKHSAHMHQADHPKKKNKVRERKRLSSGIPGLDKLIGKGFIEDDVYLVTGGTGTGKTIFCSQFINEGLKNGESCIYFSLEEMPADVLRDAKEFGWDFQKYIDKKKLYLDYQDPFEMADITSEVRRRIKNMNATRVVIDSTSIFGMIFKTKHELRKRLYELIKAVKGTGAVTLMTAEIVYGAESLSRFNVEEFVVDGIIVLRYTSLGRSSNRTLEVRKMRRTKHDEGIHTLDFGKSGLSVKG